MFSIIIPVFDPLDKLVGANAIQNMLEKLLRLKGEYEVIFVNNNNVEKCHHLSEYLRSTVILYPHKIKLIEPNENLGTSRGFNAGLYLADLSARYFVFMSTDAEIVDVDMLSKIHHTMINNPKIAISHPISVFEDNNEYNYSDSYSARCYLKLSKNDNGGDLSEQEKSSILNSMGKNRTVTTPLASFPLTFAVIKRVLVDEVGTFDEGVEKGCHENNDLAYRAMLHGYNVARINDVFINHRRKIFRDLTTDSCTRTKRPHADAIIQSTDWWSNKWGKPYDELYAKLRFGTVSYLFLPYFKTKHLASRCAIILEKLRSQQ